MTRRRMSGWMLGCLLGCGGLGLIVLIGATAGGLWVFRVFEDFDVAVQERAELEDRFGESADFHPAADGAILPDRIQAFLAVRRELLPYCDRFRQTTGSFGRMEEMDQRDEEPGLGEILGVVRSALGLAPLMGDYFSRRNGLLLEHGMGMGEYTYIYVMAYRSWLGAPIDTGLPMKAIRRRVHGEVIAMLDNQLADLRAAAGSPGSPIEVRLEAEIAALRSDPDRIPWRDGLPPALLASLEPWRAELESAYCPAAAGFDLGRNRRRGMTIHGD
ncbi:MAG: hypothetical protein PVF68_03140 [Acidobacteriota bacterium]|jgi:hypothetical protein